MLFIDISTFRPLIVRVIRGVDAFIKEMSRMEN